MNVSTYLERIDISESQAPDLEFLSKLQNQHLLNVPFENLDIHRDGNEILLDYERLYDKVVVRRRGGFCYELNGLFCWLLQELGYEVEMLSAEVYSDRTGEWGPPFDHMVLLVHLEESYLVDVGFGETSRNLLRMPDGEAEDVGGRWRISECDGLFFKEQRVKAEWHSKHRFSEKPREFSEYAEMCRYHQMSPESHFTQGRVCTLAKEWGRVTLTDKSLIITKGETKTATNFTQGMSQEEFDKHLKEQFGILLD